MWLRYSREQASQSVPKICKKVRITVRTNVGERERQRTDIAEMTEKFAAAMEKWKKEKHEITSSTSEKDREMRKLLMRIQELGIGYVPVKHDPIDQAPRRQMKNELNFPPNFEGLVLGCIDADFCK